MLLITIRYTSTLTLHSPEARQLQADVADLPQVARGAHAAIIEIDAPFLMDNLQI
jgi:hypothetical protein